MKKRNIIIACLMFILILFQSSTVFARSGGGGGGSGGGGGGGGSGGGSSTSSSHRYNTPMEKGASIVFLTLNVIIIIIMIVVKDGSSKFAVISLKKNSEAKKLIKYLQEIDTNYSDDLLQKRVEGTYFKMQEAWTSMNTDISKDYMSEDIYNLHTSKLEWMKMRHERNILKEIKLLSADPVGVEHYNDNSKDIVWYYIRGSMVDYIVNEESNELLDGDMLTRGFVEYWKFIRENDKWVIDKIMQQNEMNQEDFKVFSEKEAV